jgi:hypothetical protein
MKRRHNAARQKAAAERTNRRWRAAQMPRYVAGVALLVGLLSGLAACDQTSTTVTKPTATSTAIRLPGLPAFSDWRIAYLDATLNVHAVSVDGTSDVTGGPSLSGLSRPGWNVPPAEISPDGHLLSYLALDSFEPHSDLSMLDASGQRSPYYNYGVFGHQLEAVLKARPTW